MKARVPTAWNVREESRGDPTCPPPPRATLSTPRLPSERRPHTDTTKVAGEALLAKAVEVLSVTPVRRVTSNEVMGLHGTRRSDEGRGRGVASKLGSRWRDRRSVGCSHLHRRQWRRGRERWQQCA
jgi:hypothetical protein